MAMTKRARTNGLRRSEQLLGAGANAYEYGVGVIGPDPRRTDVLLVLIFAVAVALSFVFLGVIVIPGVLLVAAIHGAIDRPASVAVTNQGIAVLARSEINGRPRKVLTMLPRGVLTDGTVQRSGAYVHLPDFQLWFRKKEYERLLVALDNKSVANQWAAPVAVGVGTRIPSGPRPATVSPSTAAAVASPLPSYAVPGSLASQSENGSDVIYCSWCGNQRAVNAQAIHYCGSMERPAAYCMKCGSSLDEGVATCTSCGTPTTQISR
jgi:hypothetical protein